MKNFFNMLNNFLPPPYSKAMRKKQATLDCFISHFGSWAVLVLGGIVAMFDANIRPFALPAVLLVAICLVIIMRLNRSGRTHLASQIIVGIVLLGFTYLNFVSAGEPRPLILLTIIGILMGGLLLGPSGAMYAAIFLVLQNTVITVLSIQGMIAPQDAPAPPIEYIVVNGAAYLLIGFMFLLAIQRIQLAVNQLQVSNRELQEVSTALEQRVEDRTKALETVAEISTVTSTILESDKLLQVVVDLSKERFNLYHSHIYLLDEAGENLVLAAGAGGPGKQMVAEGRSIPLNREQSLVARAAREQKGVTVNDVTLERDFLPNPLLPETRSELAVPMIVGEKVIGVFDVQSDVIGRFTDADIAVQATLASQVASAVQNARLYTSAEQALRVAKDLVDYATEGLAILDLETELWAEPNENFANTFGMSREELAKTGPKQMSPPKQPDGRDSVEKAIEMINIAMKKGSHSFEWVHTTAQGNNFTCEIRLVRMPGAHPRLRQSITDITERRRTEELIKRQAQQQEALNRITQKIQSTTNIGAALQIAARELGHALGMKQTTVSLEPQELAGESKVIANE